MMKVVLVLLSLFIAVAVSTPVPWKNCGTSSDLIKIVSIDASVWPVSRGKPETVSLRVNVGQQINGGSYEIKITFDGLPLLDKKGSLKDLNLSLPILPGPLTKNVTINVPSFIPPGTASAHIVLKDDSSRSLVCVNVDIPFKSLPPDGEPEFSFGWYEDTSVAVVEEARPDVELNVPIPYKNCGKPTDKFNITMAQASVWPPKVGESIYLQINGTLSQDIQGGKYEAKVKIAGIPIIDQKGTIEDLAKKAKIPLPIKAGPYGFWKNEKIPKEVPKADIDVWVQAFNQKGDEIACIEVNAKLS